MTRSTKGHGGKRAGAGRKPKPTLVDATSLSDQDLQYLRMQEPPREIETVASRHARSALESLVRLVVAGKHDTARVTACAEILDRGYGKPAVEIGGDAPLPLMIATDSVQAARALSSEIREEARKHARECCEVLLRISSFGRSETARASASKTMLARGLGTVGVARLPDELRDRPLGKKELAARAAEAAASGIFATPPPPRKIAGEKS
jgi:hypothetical protein